MLQARARHASARPYLVVAEALDGVRDARDLGDGIGRVQRDAAVGGAMVEQNRDLRLARLVLLVADVEHLLQRVVARDEVAQREVLHETHMAALSTLSSVHLLSLHQPSSPPLPTHRRKRHALRSWLA
eukprot:888485-Rhodomonas_salina.1